MKKKSYYENNVYIDITTGNEYLPKTYCELCGITFGLTVHHYLRQSKCLKDLKAKKTRTPATWTQDFINDNQQLFTLCLDCHSKVESLSKERFYEHYGKDLNNYKYSSFD